MTWPVLLRLGIRPLLVVGIVCLAWDSAASAEECSPPCTITRNGLPTLRLVNTASGTPDWDLETSAFGVELIGAANDTPANGAFRVEHGAEANTLVLDDAGKVGIGTTAPFRELQINSTAPVIRLDDTSSGEGHAELRMSANVFGVVGETGFNILSVDTRVGSTQLSVTQSGQVGLGTLSPLAKLHVDGDARVEGDLAIASSRTLKTGFHPVSSSEILAAVANLPVASWRYEGEDDSERHIGPLAEDFQRLFGLGDGETISVIDAQGVAFAAIQGLQQELVAKEAEFDRKLMQKDAEIAELVARLAAVEERLDAP